MGDRTADGAAVAHLGVADLAGDAGQQRHVAVEGDRARGDVVVAGQRADRDVVAVVADVGELAPAGRCR